MDTKRICHFILLCTCVGAFVFAADDWPEFRGPGGQGHAVSVDAPTQWNEQDNIAWKVPIPGRGWSSPVIANGVVWMTTAVETPGNREELDAAVERVGAPVPSPYVAGEVTLSLIGVDAKSGRVVHDVTLFNDDDPVVLNSMNSYASPTPVISEGRLYCDFGALGTASVVVASGEIEWTRRLPIEHQVGPGSSPIIHGDLLILTRDGCDQQYVTALDKATGRRVWKTERPPHDTPTLVYRKAFSTPLIFDHQGKTQMVVPAAQWVVAYDPDTGREIWRADTGKTFSNASRPVYGNGRVYVCTAYGGTFMAAIRVDGRGDVTRTHVAWEQRRSTPRRSSPLLVDGRLYSVSDSGIAACTHADTGEVVWNERLGGVFSASPVYANGRIYLFGEDGTTSVIRPGDQFQRIAENRLTGRIMSTPAFVGPSIYLRTDSHLYRIGD